MNFRKSFIRKIAAGMLALAIGTAGIMVSTENTAHAAYSVSVADNIISLGSHFLGTPYKFAAKSGQTSSFDCSSFVQYVYKKNGILLPRSSKQQSTKGYTVSKANIQKGDLIFFDVTKRPGIDHVAIYAGNGIILHTYKVGIGVTYSKFSGYWSNHVVKVKRVIN
ncbi:C40 family peptidase [Ferviditalea candida]|uniref:C40 family peptidase n=1 Tax=Ferviditalea candida TaxID=3108399 RepID=A0ABU5ZJU6_9BACL|nr:C40 family peptidase [Paenibacillaceae bacterium T2]